MKIKVKTLDKDGNIAFDGEFGPHEIQFILEVGVNFLLQQGALPLIEEDEEEEDPFFPEPDQKTMQ